MIRTIRALVAARLTPAPAPLYRYLPDRVDDLPCIVVGRPSLSESDIAAIVQVSTPVFVCGRTVRDDDAQDELDGLTETITPRLWRPWSAEGVSLKLTDVDPTVLEIGGTDVPAYTLTIVAEATYC